MTGTTSSAEHACIVLRNEESSSDFRLWTIQRPGQPVELLSPTVPITEVESAREGIIATVIQHGQRGTCARIRRRLIVVVVLHSGKPLLLPRLAADPRFGSYAELNSVMSTLAVPIRSKGVTLGAMYLASSREAAFADGDLLVMDLLAMQAAVVIANGQLFASELA
jgi:GAF domain-containing protein